MSNTDTWLWKPERPAAQMSDQEVLESPFTRMLLTMACDVVVGRPTVLQVSRETIQQMWEDQRRRA